MAFVDLFESDFRVRSKVCIVAPGPNGREYYRRIPDDFQIVVVSKAVLVPELQRADVWVMTRSDQDWFDDASRRFAGIRVFSREAAERRAHEFTNSQHCYWFEPAQLDLFAVPSPPAGRAIRYGATVTACALQLTYCFGADEVPLCGADMSGDAYFDGQMNPQPFHGETWPAADRFAQLVRQLESARAFRVWTLSPTRLAVPHYSPA